MNQKAVNESRVALFEAMDNYKRSMGQTDQPAPPSADDIREKVMKARALTLTLGAAKMGSEAFEQYAGVTECPTDQVDTHLLLVDMLDDISTDLEKGVASA